MRKANHTKAPTLSTDRVFVDPHFPLDVSTWVEHPDYPMHGHEFSEIVIIAEGSGINVVRNDEFPLRAGDVFVIHGESQHAYRDTKNLTVINVTYDPRILAPIWTSRSSPATRRSSSSSQPFAKEATTINTCSSTWLNSSRSGP
jgi:mannose-6-phosphate isomerase-like protein (cupin superfamily)